MIRSRGRARARAGRGVRDAVRRLYRAHGVRGFYSGLGPTLIRAFPIHSVNFAVYEAVMSGLS